MFIEHMLGVLYHPNDEWKSIREEHYTTLRCYASHIVFLAAIPPLAAFIGTTQMGWSIGGGNFFRLTVASALPIAIAFYFALLAGAGIMAWFIHWMKNTYGSESSFDDCMVLTTFTATPLFLAGLSALIPILWVDVLVGMAAVAVTIRLLYTGVPVLMDVPEGRALAFSSSILTVGLVVLVGMLAVTAVLWGTVMGPTVSA
ncbi:Yip1 family protein [Motiliproteus sp. MSK22-1]|uniref:Yip1 family protein n=1 Tax=Motiliproteus sp. MSK22-1 TaxID=1897630 RepID=UPI0009F87CF1|nr:Yip1 family protein [Motiliproteus sp. MSK22-1]